MSLTAADYADSIREHLLPRGLAWARDRFSNLGQLIAAYAAGLGTADAAVRALPTEARPTSTTELLPEWETAAGLPDPCVTAPQTLGDRRKALVSRVRATGGASPAYFEGVARDLGYTARVEIIGNHAWRLNIAESTGVTLFRAGASRSGDRLRSFGNQRIQCVIDRLKPAHTRVQYAYGVALETV